MKTLVIRHKKENLKKCSLRGLEMRSDISFFTYPKGALPNFSGCIALSVEGPPLTAADRDTTLLLLDGTWRYAERMTNNLPLPPTRSLPQELVTAYPRRQDVETGLASVEALYAAYHILGWKTEGLLDNYYWKEAFLEKNRRFLLEWAHVQH